MKQLAALMKQLALVAAVTAVALSGIAGERRSGSRDVVEPISGLLTQPPEQYRSDFGKFRSPLVFADGTRVETPRDWQRRREEILSTWHTIMGPWPSLIERPRVEVVKTTNREDIVQQQLRIEIGLGGEMVDALLLVPRWDTPIKKHPAVVVVYYDAETGAGLGVPLRDYGWQLAKRGFVALSVGKPNARVDLENPPKKP